MGDVPYGLRHWTAMIFGPSIGVTVYINSPLHASQSVHGVSSPIVSSIAPAGHSSSMFKSMLFVYVLPSLIFITHASGASPGLSKIVTIVASLSISALTGLLNVT